ncbi:hypothetical protein [Streptomyces olivaceus]|uniref:hypothetical protein n=1 Tax=Streptomyces olivaceus TaxID=47716 RepID=UPI0036752D0C
MPPRGHRAGAWAKLHLSTDGHCRPLVLGVTGGQRANCAQFQTVLAKIRVPPGRPLTKPDSLAADKAHSNGPCREYLRRRGTQQWIPEKPDSRAAACAVSHAPIQCPEGDPIGPAYREFSGTEVRRREYGGCGRRGAELREG